MIINFIIQFVERYQYENINRSLSKHYHYEQMIANDRK